MVSGIDLIKLNLKDECCGFGGTFCVTEEAVSVKMGKDRVAGHLEHGAEYITGVDMSRLMHMEGILRRQGSKVKVIYMAGKSRLCACSKKSGDADNGVGTFFARFIQYGRKGRTMGIEICTIRGK
jgi:hypothetical protein